MSKIEEKIKMRMTGSLEWVSFSLKFLDYASQFTYLRKALTNLKDPNFKKMEEEALAALFEEQELTEENEESSASSGTRLSLKKSKKITKAALDKIQEMQIRSVLEDVKHQ